MPHDEANRAAAGVVADGTRYAWPVRIRRAVWLVAWFALARWTPPPLHAWRRLLLRAFGARVGRGARVYASARIWLPDRLTLGDRVTIGPGAILYCHAPIAIGAGSVVSQGAHLCAGTHEWRDPAFALTPRPVELGAKVWVAAEAFVAPGVQMGEGSVLAARGALFADAAPWQVYRGNPAAPVAERPRF